MANGDEGRGLYRKYVVYRDRTALDDYPGLIVPDLDLVTEPYFVLKYATDPYARHALRTYAAACHAEFPQLAADLLDELQRTEPGVL